MPVPKQGLTSLEAAALLVSGGKTKDYQEANHMASNPFDLDKLQQAHLRRMMGFDWGVDITYKKMRVYSKQAPFVESTADFSGLMDEDAVDILVETCLDVKMKWDEAKAEESDE